MGEKVAKVFMNIHRLKHQVTQFLWISVILVIVLACSPDLSDNPIPYQPFPDIILNLNLPENIALKSKGNAREISGGIRGIIVYCQDQGVYYAFERNCSYHPNDACATVNIDNSKLYMIDPCCGSTFNFSNGQPLGGVAWRPLQMYQTDYDGFELVITDNVIQ
jgi:nitrite reductase/ring-hydroxylating ferredoxin subunit